jgi:hypothetical protein
MNYGFRIVYHKDIPWTKEVKEFLDERVKHFTSPGSYKQRMDSAAFFRRGILGLCMNNEYTFKRLSRNRRIFGLVPISELKSREPIKLDQCMCAIHRGGQKVILKKPYNEQDYTTFFETGKIKG